MGVDMLKRNLSLACALVCAPFAISALNATVPGNWVPGPWAAAAVTAKPGGKHPSIPVCRGNYDNGQHPGKLWDGSCNIGWGGHTIYLTAYQLLVGNYHWQTATMDGLPANAVDGGDAGDTVGHERMGVCEVFDGSDGSWHPGKFFRNRCYFAWGGSRNNNLGKERRAIPNGNVDILVTN